MVKSIDRLANEIVRKVPESPAKEVRLFRRQVSQEIKELTGRDVIQLALNILKLNSAWNGRFVAYELVARHRDAFASLNSRNIKLLGAGIDSWYDVDMFACLLSGPAWREHQLTDSLISSWAHSKDRWWRRAAVVSTVGLNNTARGGKGDVARTLAMCRLLIADRDDMVVKAVSWALRELAKKEPGAVEEFIKEHHKQIAPRVLREVRNKLTTGLKTPKSRVSR